MKLRISLIVFSLIVFGCKNSSDPQSQQFDEVVPYGIWVYSGVEDSVSIYDSADEFENKDPGIAFKNDNVYIERTSGWCATPPLTYYNIEGKWEVFDHNRLKITCANWMNEDYGRFMEIVDHSESELKIIFRTTSE